MNWDAIGAAGEILGAGAVVLTLVYLAAQIKHAQHAMADQNRLERARGVREMAILVCSNPALRHNQIQNWGLTDYYEKLAAEEGISTEEASGVDWANSYYFWMYWGQFSSTTKPDDLAELENVIGGLLTLPGMRKSWETSPMNRPLLEPKFVEFVDSILKKQRTNAPSNKSLESDT